MNVHLVYAHPDPSSFNGVMRDTAVSYLTKAGHHVRQSDLYAMNFKAVADAEDFRGEATPRSSDYQLSQKEAFLVKQFAPDIAAEQEKLEWADVLLLQFPLWWLSSPAILKGWFDRVLAFGYCYDADRCLDQGGFAGKKALCSITTGAPHSMFEHGIYADVSGDISEILTPMLHGTLYYVGFEVLPPFVAYGASWVGDDVRKQYLEDYQGRLATLAETKPYPYPKLAAYSTKPVAPEPAVIETSS